MEMKSVGPRRPLIHSHRGGRLTFGTKTPPRPPRSLVALWARRTAPNRSAIFLSDSFPGALQDFEGNLVTRCVYEEILKIRARGLESPNDIATTSLRMPA